MLSSSIRWEVLLAETRLQVLNVKNKAPTKTWSPWNLVAIKKVLPNDLSEKFQFDEKYSNTCIREKSPPSKIVDPIHTMVSPRSFSIAEWCATVTVAPELTRKTVFTSGISNGLNGSRAKGGEIPPTSSAGLKLKWKNPQKKEKKSIASERIKLVKPIFSPDFTCPTWSPWVFLSAETFTHQ
jgi:hypothetical protein